MAYLMFLPGAQGSSLTGLPGRGVCWTSLFISGSCEFNFAELK
jgi:hypothetical protein